MATARGNCLQWVKFWQTSPLKLKAVFGTLWPYLDLPPLKISFLYWSSMLAAFITEGAFYCKGSFQEFANALVHAIEREAGEVRYKTPVQRIVVEDGRARSVVIENGKEILAPIIISNADAKQTVECLIGEEPFSPVYLNRLREMKPSLSAFVVYLATDLPLHERPYGHEGFFYRSFDHDQNYVDTCEGKVSWLSSTIPPLLDSSLAPEGEHLMILTTLMTYDIGSSWKEKKERYQNWMLDEAEQYFSGLREHLLFVESGTPTTMERYTKNSFGSVYGWDVSPDQVGPARLNVDAPIEGLFFAGRWTEPGGGVYGVVLSGLRSAQAALGCKTESELWEQLEKGRSVRSVECVER
jgi:prolycopene isomerase